MSSVNPPLEPFPKTRWTLVARVKEVGDEKKKSLALEELCQLYWPPIFAYLCSRGYPREEAEDLTQGFFSEFLRKSHFTAADSKKGKLRSYLLRAVTNHANRIRRDQNRLKRGGGEAVISLQLEDANGRPLVPEPRAESNPEVEFNRQWALTMLRNVFQSLRNDYRNRGKEDVFDALQFVISIDSAAVPYADVSEKLGCSEGSVKIAAHRLKQRYKSALREAVGDTLLEGEDIDAEIRLLMSAFG